MGRGLSDLQRRVLHRLGRPVEAPGCLVRDCHGDDSPAARAATSRAVERLRQRGLVAPEALELTNRGRRVLSVNPRVSGPLKWHGGKGAHGSKLACWIVGLMPPHLNYVEPFAGGLAVLLARDPEDPRLWLPGHKGVSEVVGDLDGRLVNFFRVLRDEQLFARFFRQVETVPLSRAEWEAAQAHEYGRGDPVADAVAFFVCCRQSLAGRMKGFTPLSRTRLRKGRNGNVSEWIGAVEGLPAVHARLWKRVAIEHMLAVKLIRREDGPGTLFYCDPPYLPRTRTARKVYGEFEMSEAGHRELLDVLLACRGKVMLSGYSSPLYDALLAGWTRHTLDVPNNASGAKKKDREIEVLWCNF
jgi:DNA adenine methylase